MKIGDKEMCIRDRDSMEQVMRTFDDTKAWNLPVVDAENKSLSLIHIWRLRRYLRTFVVSGLDCRFCLFTFQQ